MFDGQIAPTTTPKSTPDPQKDQAHRHLAPTGSVALPAEIDMLDLTPRQCLFCPARVGRFDTVCEMCRADGLR